MPIFQGSLVEYKKRPARVVQVGERLELELESGEHLRVRPKDVLLIHPGPLANLARLTPLEGEVSAAWELLAAIGEPTTLAELAELIYGEYTPAAAWAAWGWVEQGVYFRGTPEKIWAYTQQQVERALLARQARAAEEQTWQDFLDRLRQNKIKMPEDRDSLREVEDLALGRRNDSRILRA